MLLSCLTSVAVAQSTPDRFKPARLECNSPEPARHHVPQLYANIDVDSAPPWPMQVLFTYFQPNGRYGSSSWKYSFCHTLDWLRKALWSKPGEIVVEKSPCQDGSTWDAERLIQNLGRDSAGMAHC